MHIASQTVTTTTKTATPSHGHVTSPQPGASIAYETPSVGAGQIVHAAQVCAAASTPPASLGPNFVVPARAVYSYAPAPGYTAVSQPPPRQKSPGHMSCISPAPAVTYAPANAVVAPAHSSSQQPAQPTQYVSQSIEPVAR